MSSVVEFIPIPGLVRTRLTAVGVGYNCTLMHLLNFDAGVNVLPTDITSVLNIIYSWVTNHYIGQINQKVRFVSIEAWDGGDQFGAAGSRNFSDVFGTAVSEFDFVDYAKAPRIGLKTGARGRAATGAIYCFPPVQEAIQPQAYATDHMDGLVAALGYLQTAANSAAYPWVVASESRLAKYPIIGFKPTVRLTEQTRRRPDFGR
jgi:hypothetical protein